MHLMILLALGGASVLLLARTLSGGGIGLRERVAPLLAIALGLVMGVLSALIALSTQIDIVPDDIEAGLAPFLIVGVTVALGLGVGYRTLRH